MFDNDTIIRHKLAAMRLIDPKMTKKQAFWKIIKTAFEPGDSSYSKRQLTKYIDETLTKIWDDNAQHTN